MTIQFTLEGTVRAAGSLELDGAVPMPAGRVLVTVQPAMQPPPDDPFWQGMENIWAGQRARGHNPRTREQIDAAVRSGREAAEAELLAAEHLYEEARKARSGDPEGGA